MKLRDLTISDVAAEIRIRRAGVVSLAESGAIEAYDVSAPGAKRKSYRITRQALDQFRRDRSAKQVRTSRRKPKTKQPADFVEYF
jgi:predicted RNA-binding protein with PIN domain